MIKNNGNEFIEYEKDMESLKTIEDALSHAKGELALGIRTGKITGGEVMELIEEFEDRIQKTKEREDKEEGGEERKR